MLKKIKDSNLRVTLSASMESHLLHYVCVVFERGAITKYDWRTIMRMRSLAVLAVYFILQLGTSSVHAQVSPRVIGGSDAPQGAYPWMVALVYGDIEDSTEAQFCGGALIAPQYILTAAHCAELAYYYPVQAIIGGGPLSFGRGNRKEIVGPAVHSEFDYYTLEHDLALLKLKEPQAGPYLRVAGQADAGLVAEGVTGTLLGYGETSSYGPVLPIALQAAQIPLHDDKTCLTDLGRYYKPSSMMCAGLLSSDESSDDGVASCYGDSGSPLVVKASDGEYSAVGITSWGMGEHCASSKFFGVYAEAAAHESFISSFPTIAPFPIGYPWIVGDSVVGSTLSCDGAQFGGDPVETIAYRWYVDDGITFSQVVGADSSTYLTVAGDSGKTLICSVTASNAGGESWETYSSPFFVSDVSPALPQQTPEAIGTPLSSSSAPSADSVGPQASFRSLACRNAQCALTTDIEDDQSGIASAQATVTLVYSGQCKRGGSLVSCSKTRISRVVGVYQSGATWKFQFKAVKRRKQLALISVTATDASANQSPSSLLVSRRIKSSSTR